MDAKQQAEISLWRNVEYLDGEKVVTVGSREVLWINSNNNQEQAGAISPDHQQVHSMRILLNVLALTLRQYTSVVYIRVDSMFIADQLHDLTEILEEKGAYFASQSGQSMDLQGLLTPSKTQSLDWEKAESSLSRFLLEQSLIGFTFGSKESMVFVELELQCQRGYHCDPFFRYELAMEQMALSKKHVHSITERGLEVLKEGVIYYCYILLRDDVLYWFDFAHHAKKEQDHDKHVHLYEFDFSIPPSTSGNQRIRVAIGMPTMSVSQTLEETAPVKTFVPSFLESVTEDEAKRYEYIIYMGYDQGDKFFELETTRKAIDDRLQSLVSAKNQLLRQSGKPEIQVKFEYVRFPFSKGWVTYIWNGLFVHAMKDGCHYFYQVNDDLHLNSAGWTALFVEQLEKHDGFGVVGPYDVRHGGRLLTQAFVGRKHYAIFGRFYPLDIKVR